MDEYGDDELDFSEIEDELDSEFEEAELDVMEVMDEDDLPEFDETADLTSEISEEESYVDQVMDAAPEETEVADREALERMNEYMAEHDYGRDDYETYSRDPEWRELNRELTEEDGLEPAGDALEQMNDYMIEHDYGREDFAEYTQDPEWQALNQELIEADGLEVEELPDGDVKVLTRDSDELMEAGMAAIEQNMEAIRDDLHDKGIDDPVQVEEIIEEERSAAQEEFMHDAFGLDSGMQEETDEAIEADEGPVNQILELPNETDELPGGNLEEEADVDGLTEDEPDLERDIDESGAERDIDESGEKRDIDEFGPERDVDESGAERDMDESGQESDIDESDEESDIEESDAERNMDESGFEQDMDGSVSETGMTEEIPPEEIDRILEEGSRDELEELRDILLGTAAASELETAATMEPSVEGETLLENEEETLMQEGNEFTEAEKPLDPEQIDYDAVYESLDEYDFGEIDCFRDPERLDGILDGFKEETWQEMSLDGQKETMKNLADYVAEVTGLESPPEISFYNNPKDGDYGGYDSEANLLTINEYMLGDSKEAADTVAHELWHAYQTQRSLNPQNARDYQYQYNFDNYIEPEDDFEGYQEQLVEAEARAFANQLKDRLSQIKGGNV